MTDRLAEIKEWNCYDSNIPINMFTNYANQCMRNINWLIAEVERLRDQIDIQKKIIDMVNDNYEILEKAVAQAAKGEFTK